MNASKLLKLSAKYPFIPNAINFKTISIVKIIIKVKLAQIVVFINH